MTAPVKIGRYEIVRQIGKSMTDVYLAIDTVENRKAALKLIKCDGDLASQMILEAEQRGAAIQKELQVLDPRVVEIYEFGSADGYFFVAMQYVEGHNLADVLRADGVIEPVRAAAIALEICEQLAKFHTWQSAVVHGDIKPSNIHLGPHDTVRLLDFGIAKTLRADGDATIHDFGSPSYCSPERLSRSLVDQQSDLWAVGATLYEMLAGVPPYRAESTRRLESLIRSKRPPRALPSGCPRALRTIVTKALAPAPARRYRSAAEFQADLQAFLEHKPTLAESEWSSRWSANATATLEAARECLRKVTRTARRVRSAVQWASAFSWFAAGMVLWIGGSLAFEAWQRHRVAAPAAAAAPPAAPTPNETLASLYAAAAEQIIEAHRTSADPVLADFDWHKAEIWLERAVSLGAGDDRTLGRLALAKGYATLERVSEAPYSDRAAARLRMEALDQLALAAQKMPRDPGPHLALAHLYVYAIPDVDRAMEEFFAAERLGAGLGGREIEQEGDAYRLRAKRELQSSPKLALADIGRARELYQRIPGFDLAGEHLQELAHMHPGRARRKPAPRRVRWR